ADEKLNKLTDRDVRIIYLPPATVASAHTYGGDPEHDTDVIMGKFMQDVELFNINPGARFYGFNNDVDGQHGYEVWATIPDDLDVPEPLTKKKFAGGLYAAHTSKPINFGEWKLFYDWVADNEDFEIDNREPFGMDGCLEEHINSYNLYGLKNRKYVLTHIDFLIPIKEKI
ncbi:MAG: GyrI-like domain-containing protein, partial [Oscillospiraceae bacterium]|nr:GyrI-like domain-containing protein [Oscillospiraceae bacterium]